MQPLSPTRQATATAADTILKLMPDLTTTPDVYFFPNITE
jgi:hypothetical protein